MSANTDTATEETTSLDKTINELDNSTKFGATGGYVPFQKNNVTDATDGTETEGGAV